MKTRELCACVRWSDVAANRHYIVEQTTLSFSVETIALQWLDGVVTAITCVQVRGAPLIGVAAAYGIAMAMAVDFDANDASPSDALITLRKTRPTA